MKEDKNLKNENEVVNYDPSQETYLDVWVEANKYFIPLAKVDEDSNVAYIGYCEENHSLVIQYKVMKYSKDILLLMIDETLNELEDCKDTLERSGEISCEWEDKIREIYNLVKK